MAKITWNLKKLFKGQDVYGFGKNGYGYACSPYLCIKTKQSSDLHQAIKTDIIFSPWTETRTKVDVMKTAMGLFDNAERSEMAMSPLCLDGGTLGLANIFLGEDVVGPFSKLIQKNYMDIVSKWGVWNVYTERERTKPFIFIHGDEDDMAVAIMPVRDNIIKRSQIEDFLKTL